MNTFGNKKDAVDEYMACIENEYLELEGKIFKLLVNLMSLMQVNTFELSVPVDGVTDEGRVSAVCNGIYYDSEVDLVRIAIDDGAVLEWRQLGLDSKLFVVSELYHVYCSQRHYRDLSGNVLEN